MKVAILGFILLTSSLVVAAPPVPTATQAINALGLDLWRATSSTKDNLLLSPYSIQSALAMTYAGAAGVTRDEMMKVLHYPQDASTLHDSFAQLRLQLATGPKSTKSAEPGKTHDATVAPLTLSVANRLYAQRDYAFKTNFLSLLNGKYDTSLVPVDFKKNAAGVATEINKWVEQQTHERIRNLISPTALDESTRLVLVNALYFKAVWAESFPITATTTEPFNIRGGAEAEVPMMIRRSHFGHVPFRGGQAVTVPYRGGEFQFLILLPDSTNGLSELQKTLTPEFLQQCASLKQRDVVLHLPKFTFEPPTLALSSVLKVLGMKTAFDEPFGTADFSGMAIRRPDDYLAIKDVFHKTFIVVDEQGTEAAAATAVVTLSNGGSSPSPGPIHVNVDRPFVFAIQHRASGACLFLGQVVDPRP